MGSQRRVFLAATGLLHRVAAFCSILPSSSAGAAGSAAAVATCSVLSAASTMPFKSRSVDQVVLSVAQAEGAGATVRRSIGGAKLRNFDPFLMLDEAKVAPPAGFPDHPHRGFETVSYMLEGTFKHEDFVGHRGDIGKGDLQWMTAGRGILHSEMPGPEGAHGLQLWVNLAAKDKMCEPAYQELKKEDIPVAVEGGVTAVVIAGSALGVTSPVYTRTPTSYIHFKMQPRSSVDQAIPVGWNCFLYTLGGAVAVGEAGSAADTKDEPILEPIGAHHTVTLTRDGDGVTLRTLDEPADFVLIGGQPLNEPIVQHGPFVMNTREEIMQAMRDYQTGQNGFENARGWYSEIGLPITHAR
ncbi:unnamed protein product [Phaeothamnion confervicola]